MTDPLSWSQINDEAWKWDQGRASASLKVVACGSMRMPVTRTRRRRG